MGDRGDDPATPVFDYLPGLIGEDFARHPQVALVILFRKPRADFQIFKFAGGDRRDGDLGCSIRI